jgi:hypothetical protein
MEYVNLSIMPRKLFVLMAMAAGCSLTPIDAMALNAVQITQQVNSAITANTSAALRHKYGYDGYSESTPMWTNSAVFIVKIGNNK